jgi:hypothetical protein
MTGRFISLTGRSRTDLRFFCCVLFLSQPQGTGPTRIARQLGGDCGVCQQETAGEGPKTGVSVRRAAGWYGSACAPRPPVQHDTFECLEPTPRGEHGGRLQEVGACVSSAGVAAGGCARRCTSRQAGTLGARCLEYARLVVRGIGAAPLCLLSGFEQAELALTRRTEGVCRPACADRSVRLHAHG